MSQDINSPDYTIGVIGTGTMGRGIAQISVVGGYKVKMFDAQEGAAAKAEEFIHRMVNRAAEKGQITEGEAEAANGRLVIVNSLSKMGDCSLVIEAIVENLEKHIKHIRGRFLDLVKQDNLIWPAAHALS